MLTVENHITARWRLVFRDAGTPSTNLLQRASGALLARREADERLAEPPRLRQKKKFLVLMPRVLLPEYHHDQRHETENRDQNSPSARPVNELCRRIARP